MDSRACMSGQSHPDSRHPRVREDGDKAMPEAVERPTGKLLLPLPLDDHGIKPGPQDNLVEAHPDRPRLPLVWKCGKVGTERSRGMMRRHMMEMLYETFVERYPTHFPVFFCWNRRNPVSVSTLSQVIRTQSPKPCSV